MVAHLKTFVISNSGIVALRLAITWFGQFIYFSGRKNL